MTRRYYRQNMIAGLVVAAVGVAAFFLTLGMPGHAPIFPRVASVLLAVLGVFLAVASGLGMKHEEQLDKKPVALHAFINPVYSIIIMVAYAAAIKITGFYTATALMMIVYMHHLGVRSAKTILGVTAIVSVLVYFVFTMQLDVPLPAGFLL